MYALFQNRSSDHFRLLLFNKATIPALTSASKSLSVISLNPHVDIAALIFSIKHSLLYIAFVPYHINYTTTSIISQDKRIRDIKQSCSTSLISVKFYLSRISFVSSTGSTIAPSLYTLILPDAISSMRITSPSL